MTKIRMGFIGAGGIARAHVKRLLDVPEAEIVAFAEPSEASMARMVEATPARQGRAGLCRLSPDDGRGRDGRGPDPHPAHAAL